MDIDHFKVVNDTYGHLVGDRVLKAIAEALTGQSRDYDRAGRFGGEEFVLLLAQTGEHDACKIAERLRGYIAGLEIPTDDRPDAPTLTVTISIGVTAMARGESYELTDLLAAADSAMYAAKQAGRNQVAFARPLRDMGLEAAWDPAADGAGEPQPPPPRGRLAAVQPHAWCWFRRSRPPLLYAREGHSPCSLRHSTRLHGKMHSAAAVHRKPQRQRTCADCSSAAPPAGPCGAPRPGRGPGPRPPAGSP